MYAPPHAGVAKLALNSIINEIRTSTATMTSVPKPLKFLSPHIDSLKERCDKMKAGENKQLLADIVSVLCTTVGLKEGVRDALKFRLQVRACCVRGCL
jgi:26S proteasome regulatory subunit N1